MSEAFSNFHFPFEATPYAYVQRNHEGLKGLKVSCVAIICLPLDSSVLLSRMSSNETYRTPSGNPGDLLQSQSHFPNCWYGYK